MPKDASYTVLQSYPPEAVGQWPCGILEAGCWGLCVETEEEAVCLMLEGGLPGCQEAGPFPL